jgi:hypothetical protein
VNITGLHSANLHQTVSNLVTEVASSGRHLAFSSIPTGRTCRIASVCESHQNLSSAPERFVVSLPHMTADLGSPQGHAGPCTLPKICRLQPLTSLQLDALASLPYLPSLIPLRKPATHSPPHRVPAQHTLTVFPLSFFLDQPNGPFSRLSKLVFFPPPPPHWLARWSCESQAVLLCPTGEPMGIGAHAAVSLLLPT